VIYWIALHLPQKIREAVALQFMRAAVHFNGREPTLGDLLDKVEKSYGQGKAR